MEVSVLKTIKRLRKEAPRRFTELRESCDELVALIGTHAAAYNDIDADKYFGPYQAACESRQPRLMEIALDGLHNLIEHGYLRGKKKLSSTAATAGDDPDDKSSGRRTLMDLIIETINKCSEDFDEGVQVQVIKALLIAVTSSHCEVHEASLLLAIRACFHIHLISKNQINKTTAKAALTQMLSVVNQRMENFDARAKAETDAALSIIAESFANSATKSASTNDSESVNEIKSQSDRLASEVSAVTTLESENTATAADKVTELNGSIVAEESTSTPPKAVKNNTDTDEIDADEVATVADSTSDDTRTADVLEVDESAPLESTASALNESEAEPIVAKSTTISAADASHGGGNTMAFPSIMHKDAFLIFRALCKLSMKGLHESDESGSLSDPIALQNKVLSLELILHILRSSGLSFRTGEKFIYAVRNYLCVSLLGNCTSQVTQVVGLSLQIFLALMDDFKDHLKSELEVFITTIFLRILESENSTYDHKLRVLEVFHRICKDSSALVEIFINYDCEMDAIDLFRRVVDGFAKISKNPSTQTRGSGDFLSTAGGKRVAVEEQQNIRGMGLKGLVIVLQSLLKYGGLWQGVAPDIVDIGDLLGEEYLGSVPKATTAADQVYRNPGTVSAEVRQEDEENSNGVIKIDETVSIVPEGKGRIVDNFDRKQKAQEEIETGILKFNQSSKKGIAFLAERGHLEMTPKSVAHFLRQYSEKLDKTAVGEYLGREREYEGGFCLKVLHEFVDSMDFSGMAFDLAIRYFLAGFRLPGEAQKIDRLMEKFAERYYLQNKDTFASADMAFILAFSTIMLQTNLHNPAIKDDKRMTKEQFVRQNKGISADGELPEEMLLEIYERIAAAPISMTQDVARRNKKEEVAQFNVFQTSTDKRRKDAFNDERKEMVRNGEAMFKQASKKTSVFVRNLSRSSEAYVRPMFEVVWAPIIGVLSEILETCDDAATVNSSLAGLYYAIRLACRLDFPTARHTFLNALAKFTTLETVREMHSKQVSCIKLMLNIALTEGSYLDESWSKVLQCVSQLARLQLFANRSHTDDMFFSDVSSHTQDGSSSTPGKNKRPFAPSSLFSSNTTNVATESFTFTKLFSGPSKAESARQMEEMNATLLMQEINPIVLDRIFLGSSCLGGDSVHHFVLCLCEVSMLEISSSSSLNNLRAKEISGDTANPRVFSLQKLVEVADVNMFSRPRLQWGRIWSLLAAHFTSVGLHENAALAMYAIDSLKQLSIKFLQKEELSNFNFQRVFLKPFEVILARTGAIEIKDLVLRCIDVLVRACASNIRSGWRSIFVTFEVAAAQDSQDIARIALDITERLLVTQFDLLIFDFVELINCLVSFVAGVHSTLSLRALDHLYRCAGHLADGTIEPALDVRIASTAPSFPPISSLEIADKTSTSDITDGNTNTNGNGNGASCEEPVRIEEDASVFRLWWPLLLGLSTRVADPREQVRERALSTLTNVLRTYGSMFSPQTWVVIFKGILFPMIDSAKTDNSWIVSMCSDVLSVCIEMLCMLHDMNSLSPTLLPDLISIIESCVCQESEVLARIGMKAWNELMSALKTKMNVDTLNLICSRLLRCVLANLCRDFGDAGMLSVNVSDLKGNDSNTEWLNQLVVPPNIVKLLIDTPCPIAARRRERQRSLSGVEDIVGHSRPSSSGHRDGKMADLSEILSDDESSVASSVVGSESEVQVPSSSKKTIDYNSAGMWKQYSAMIKTSAVVTLSLCKLIGDLLLASGEVFQIGHLEQLLTALEVQYWHTLLFHGNVDLLTRLAQKGFVVIVPGPHLIDQEVQSARIILRTIIDIYLTSNSKEKQDADSTSGPGSSAGAELDVFVAPWISRMGKLTCTRYLQLEKERGAVGGNVEASSVALHRHNAYKPVALLLLKGILDCSLSQFSSNAIWLVPLLSQMILCDDYNIRLFVRDIYVRHVDPILLVTFPAL